MQTHTFLRLNIFEGYYLLGACGGPKQMYIWNGRQLTLLKSCSFEKVIDKICWETNIRSSEFGSAERKELWKHLPSKADHPLYQ